MSLALFNSTPTKRPKKKKKWIVRDDIKNPKIGFEYVCAWVDSFKVNFQTKQGPNLCFFFVVLNSARGIKTNKDVYRM